MPNGCIELKYRWRGSRRGEVADVGRWVGTQLTFHFIVADFIVRRV